MPTYIITGSNRGLGLEFIRQLSPPSTSNTIIACVRSLETDISDLKTLQSHASPSSQILIYECDTSSIPSIYPFHSRLAAAIGPTTKIDYLLNNGGINAAPDLTSLNLTSETLNEHMTVNVLGPAKMVEILLPHLHRGSVVMNMSSELASIGNVGTPAKATMYSISKAALNMLTVHQAVQLRDKGIVVYCMDPGWVKTRIGGTRAVLEPEESIRGMLAVLGRAGEGESGKYLEYSGKEVPW